MNLQRWNILFWHCKEYLWDEDEKKSDEDDEFIDEKERISDWKKRFWCGNIKKWRRFNKKQRHYDFPTMSFWKEWSRFFDFVRVALFAQNDTRLSDDEENKISRGALSKSPR